MMQATVEEVLYWYDGPLIVRGATTDGLPVIGLVLDPDDWSCVVAVVSYETLAEAMNSTLALREVFTTNRIGPVYRSTIGGEKHVMQLEPVTGEPPDDWLPDPGMFLHATRDGTIVQCVVCRRAVIETQADKPEHATAVCDDCAERLGTDTVH